MIKLFYKLFNHDKIDEMHRTIEIYKERNSQLESEVKEYKGYKLKYEVTKLYVEDDEALIELLEAASNVNANESKQRMQLHEQYQRNSLANLAAMQQHPIGRSYAGYGIFGGLV